MLSCFFNPFGHSGQPLVRNRSWSFVPPPEPAGAELEVEMQPNRIRARRRFASTIWKRGSCLASFTHHLSGLTPTMGTMIAGPFKTPLIPCKGRRAAVRRRRVHVQRVAFRYLKQNFARRSNLATKLTFNTGSNEFGINLYGGLSNATINGFTIRSNSGSISRRDPAATSRSPTTTCNGAITAGTTAGLPSDRSRRAPG